MLPQIIYISLAFAGLGATMAKHGEPHKPYNAWDAIIAIVIGFSIQYWGGFYDVFFR